MMTHQDPACPPDAVAGIDVAKGWLDVAVGAGVERVGNARAPLEALAARLRALGVRRVGLEPTGGHEALAVAVLRAAGLDVRMVDSWRLRQFAKARGTRAKTDRLDARMIRDFAAREATRPWPDPGEAQAALALWAREAARAEADLVRLRARLAACREPALRALLEAEAAALRATARAADQAVEGLLAAGRDLARRAEVLASVPGVGWKTVRVLMAEMPELGAVGPGQAAALAGVAPYHRHSGTRATRSVTEGGRRAVKRAAFLAARTAIRYAPHFRAVYRHLLAAGKPHKVAVVAVARRLVVTLNAMLRNDTTWAEPAQTQTT